MALIEKYSTRNRNICDQARTLLQDKNLTFQNYDIGSDETVPEEFRQRLPRTFAPPQIFIDGEQIGSYEDLVILESEGKLDEL